MDYDMIALTSRSRPRGHLGKTLWSVGWGGRIVLIGGIGALLFSIGARTIGEGSGVVGAVIAIIAVWVLVWCVSSARDLSKFLKTPDAKT